jgi:hypothetical protein
MTRAAAEAQLERNQRHIEQGRHDMKKYQKSAANKAGEDGEGSDGSENEETTTAKQSARKRKVNRSVFGDANTTAEIRMQMLQERISAVACGVSRKTSAKFGELPIPAAPMRVGGVVKLITTQDKKRALRKPVIAESRGMQEALARPLVGISLVVDVQPQPSYSAAATAAAVAVSPVKSKRGKEGGSVVFAAPPPPTSENTLLVWSHDRLQSTILEQSTAVSMGFQHRVDALQQARLHSAELVQKAARSETLSLAPTENGDDLTNYSGEERLSLNQLQLNQPSPLLDVDALSTGVGKDPYLHGLSHYLKKKPRPSPVVA